MDTKKPFPTRNTNFYSVFKVHLWTIAFDVSVMM